MRRRTFLHTASVAGGLAMLPRRSRASAVGMAVAEPRVVDVTGELDPRAAVVAVIEAWRRVELDAEAGGSWCVLGDVDGDGEVEVVSAQTAGDRDRHFTAAVAVQKLDGTLLWRWTAEGLEAGDRRRELYHDVACQLHDWDGDGRPEVMLLTRGVEGDELLVLDGGDASVITRWPVPEHATDCLAFADLRGIGRATDVIVKTRYGQAWAFDDEGRELWSHRPPPGQELGHYPHLFHLDGPPDVAPPSVLIGFTMLGPDGSPRWNYQPQTAKLNRSAHVDSAALLRGGESPEDIRLVLTGCNGLFIACVTGDGRTLWERTSEHYESVQVGRDADGEPYILVDLDHTPWGQSPVLVLDEYGRERTRLITDRGRHHCPIDWTGEDTHLLALAQARGLFDTDGRRLATLATHPADGEVRAVLPCDLTGSGLRDLMLTTWTGTAAYLYTRPTTPHETTPGSTSPATSLGTAGNATLY